MVYYYLEDHTIMLNEPKKMNSGTPQGVFLKRQMVLKQDGSGLPLLPQDFNVGVDVGIAGRSIRIFDCDQYTRDYFQVSFPSPNSFRTSADPKAPLLSIPRTTSPRSPRSPLSARKIKK